MVYIIGSHVCYTHQTVWDFTLKRHDAHRLWTI